MIDRIDKKLGIKYPIIQGGMANIATGSFAAAVSNAGGLGLVGAGGMDVEMLEREIHKCRELTDKPFGVNIMLMHPQAEQMAELVRREKIKVITTGAGNPGKYIDGWKENGSLVMPVVSSGALAKMLERAGADYLIAEGTESGGHVGEMTTLTLVPQVLSQVNIPVIAAGGIANGEQFYAAMSLGVSGVQVGTCLLVSEECPIHDNYKEALIKSKDNGTTVTGRTVGAPVRIIKNKMSREYIKKERAGAEKMELEQFTLGSLRRAVFDGDTVTGSLMAGQVCGQLDEIKPVSEILENMYSEAKVAHDRMNKFMEEM